MTNQLIWKQKDWLTALSFPIKCVIVTKILIYVFWNNAQPLLFPLPLVFLDSENNKVDYSSTFEIIPLGNSIYALKSELTSEHHTQLQIEVQNGDFSVLDGSVWIEFL